GGYSDRLDMVEKFSSRRLALEGEEISHLQTIKIETDKMIQSAISGYDTLSDVTKEYVSTLAGSLIANADSKKSIEAIKDAVDGIEFNDSLKKSFDDLAITSDELRNSTEDNFEGLLKSYESLSDVAKKGILDSSGLDENSTAYKDL